MAFRTWVIKGRVRMLFADRTGLNSKPQKSRTHSLTERPFALFQTIGAGQVQGTLDATRGLALLSLPPS